MRSRTAVLGSLRSCVGQGGDGSPRAAAPLENAMFLITLQANNTWTLARFCFKTLLRAQILQSSGSPDPRQPRLQCDGWTDPFAAGLITYPKRWGRWAAATAECVQAPASMA